MQNSLRRAVRTAAVMMPAGLVLALADTASADEPSTWEPSEGLSGLDVLLIYVLAPLALFVVIGLLASINPGKYADSYPVRPAEHTDRELTGEEWIGGPEEIESSEPDGTLPEGAESPRPGGGASASW